jgi:hypothetical protein
VLVGSFAGVSDMFSNERVESNMTPRLRAESVGATQEEQKEMRKEEILDRCLAEPIKRYSGCEGLTVRRFDVSQL